MLWLTGNDVAYAVPPFLTACGQRRCSKAPSGVQAYISRARVDSFSLVADLMYVSQNASRICRAVFEICLRRGWPAAAELTLTLCKVQPGPPAAALLARTLSTAL